MTSMEALFIQSPPTLSSVFPPRFPLSGFISQRPWRSAQSVRPLGGEWASSAAGGWRSRGNRSADCMLGTQTSSQLTSQPHHACVRDLVCDVHARLPGSIFVRRWGRVWGELRGELRQRDLSGPAGGWVLFIRPFVSAQQCLFEQMDRREDFCVSMFPVSMTTTAYFIMIFNFKQLLDVWQCVRTLNNVVWKSNKK